MSPAGETAGSNCSYFSREAEASYYVGVMALTVEQITAQGYVFLVQVPFVIFAEFCLS